MADERSALFVRIPISAAKRLESHAKRLGQSKQDLVSTMIAEGLSKSSPRHSATPVAVEQIKVSAPLEILTLDELAEFLRVDRSILEARLASGELPARRFGDEWRFSREAVLRWMEGSDRSDKRTTGFAKSPSASR
jgi:excisionase family DNA binding protein